LKKYYNPLYILRVNKNKRILKIKRKRMKVYIDGGFYEKNEAKVSVFDHGFLYGDGVFEGMCLYEKRVFKLTEHIDRLYDSAKAIMLTIPLTKEEMIKAVLQTCSINGLKNGYIRLIVSRGAGDLGLDVRKCSKALIVIIADQITLYPAEFYQKGLSIISVPTRRSLPEALNPAIKSLNYLNNILAKIEATNSGSEEAIMMNQEGYVTECSGDNIFIVKNGVLKTPPAYMGILEGITRNTVLDLAQKNTIKTQETPMTRYDLYTAQECFLTGSAAEIIPVIKVDGRCIGDGKVGPTTQKLMGFFKEEVLKNGTLIS